MMRISNDLQLQWSYITKHYVKTYEVKDFAFNNKKKKKKILKKKKTNILN